MKKDLFILFSLSVIVILVYFDAFFVFFAQDDFILIEYFAKNNLLQDIRNIFAFPTVTHWRPIHNLYFFIAGNLFDENYIGYHFVTFIFQIASLYLIYKVVTLLTKLRRTGLITAILYGINPSHFVSLFWISGGATILGFFFLLASFYSFLIKKKNISTILYAFSLLASEAMLVGLGIFTFYLVLIKRQVEKAFLIRIALIWVTFLITRLIFFKWAETLDSYKVEFNENLFGAVKYYILRTLGFAESSGDSIANLLLITLIILIVVFLANKIKRGENIKFITFSFVVIFIGFFPFVLIPNHLSPHYMNVSIFGFSLLSALTLIHSKKTILFYTFVFLAISILNINQTKNNNWVIKRSNLAEEILKKIQAENPDSNSKLVFEDNELFTSYDAYISLGTGKAIDFWFREKNYNTCFSRFEKCNSLP